MPINNRLGERIAVGSHDRMPHGYETRKALLLRGSGVPPEHTPRSVELALELGNENF